MMGEYFKVDARFYFWDGKQGYTVHYQSGISKWFIFNEREEGNCVYQKDQRLKYSEISFAMAQDVLWDYLESKNQ